MLRDARGDTLRAYSIGPGAVVVAYLADPSHDLVVYRAAAARDATAIEADLVLTALRLAAAALHWLDPRACSGRVRVNGDDAWVALLDRDQRPRFVAEWGHDRLPSTVLRPFSWPVQAPPPTLVTSTLPRPLSPVIPPLGILAALWEEAEAKRHALGSSPDYPSVATAKAVLPLGTASQAVVLVRWQRFDTNAADWAILLAKVGLPDANPWNLYVTDYEHPLAVNPTECAEIIAEETADDRRRMVETFDSITRLLHTICFMDGQVNVITTA